MEFREAEREREKKREGERYDDHLKVNLRYQFTPEISLQKVKFFT